MIDAYRELKSLQQRIIERKEEIFHDPEFLRTDSEHYMAEYPQGCVRYEHYVELFKSEAFSTVLRFILRYSILSEYQIEKLKQICKPSKYNSFDVPSHERSPQQQHLVFDFPCKERQV